jgi:ribonuclease E
VSLKLVEIGRHDGHAGVGKLNGHAIVVADGGSLIGKKVTARVERVMGGVAYATLISPAPRIDDPITAEAEAERPTRARRTKAKTAVADTAPLGADVEADLEEEAEELGDEVDAVADEPVSGIEPDDGETPADTPKKKTRRGTRGGRNRKRKPTVAGLNGDAPENAEEPELHAEPDAEAEADAAEPQVEEKPKPKPRTRRAAPARIHLPPDTLGDAPEPAAPSVNGGEPPADAAADSPEPTDEAPADEAAADGDDQPKPKKKTRRGTRGGRNRKRKPAGAAQAADGPAEPSAGE